MRPHVLSPQDHTPSHLPSDTMARCRRSNRQNGEHSMGRSKLSLAHNSWTNEFLHRRWREGNDQRRVSQSLESSRHQARDSSGSATRSIHRASWRHTATSSAPLGDTVGERRSPGRKLQHDACRRSLRRKHVDIRWRRKPLQRCIRTSTGLLTRRMAPRRHNSWRRLTQSADPPHPGTSLTVDDLSNLGCSYQQSSPNAHNTTRTNAFQRRRLHRHLEKASK